MADVRMQMVVAVARNEKKKKKRGVKKDIHGYEQKYLFYGDILQIMLTIFSHSYIHASLLWVGLISNNRGWRKLKCTSLVLISKSHIVFILIPLKCATSV